MIGCAGSVLSGWSSVQFQRVNRIVKDAFFGLSNTDNMAPNFSLFLSLM